MWVDMEKMQLVVLMGGHSTRLAPLNYSMPKGLLNIKQKPAIFNIKRCRWGLSFLVLKKFARKQKQTF